MLGPAARAVPLFLLLLVACPASAQDRSFIVVRDDGTVATHALRTGADVQAISDAIFADWQTAAAALGASTTPAEIQSVWSTFPLGGSPLPTIFVPMSNDVTGIGLDQEYAGSGARPDGTFDSPHPPARAMLLHNDFTQMPARAAYHRAPETGYARYLFLLELSHVWGPALRVPGTAPDELIGFSFHWSFWMDAGGSIAGGNHWTDLGDGTFRAERADPATLRYSMLDLYVMGLASAAEVQPIGVLEIPMPPASETDPFGGGAISGMTFPWMGPDTLIVPATRRALTIDDVVTTNGARVPAAGTAPTDLSADVILLVGASATDADIAAVTATFGPYADSLEAAYADATQHRGALHVRRYPDPLAAADAGIADAGASDAAVSPDASSAAPAGGACGCTVVGARRGGGGLALMLAIAALARRRSRAR